MCNISTLTKKSSNDVPNSVQFLCSAHDYLGPLSLCTAGNGKLLTLLVNKIVDTLFKGVGNKIENDQLCRNIDQAFFCLYAHPSKKSKNRYRKNLALVLVKYLVPEKVLVLVSKIFTSASVSFKHYAKGKAPQFY